MNRNDSRKAPGGEGVSRCTGVVWAASVIVAAVLSSHLFAQALVSPVFVTAEDPDANVDSCAVWAGPGGLPELLGENVPLVFVTEKEGDRIQVWNASTGEPYAPQPYLGGAMDSSAPGEFDRPNGVWVIYHVPVAGGFADVLVVTDQTNERVQVFDLPALEYLGAFGEGEVGKGYGISWYHDGTDIFVYITDQIPPEAFPGKIKRYRLRPEGAGVGADLVNAFGSSDGPPELDNVESLLADPYHERLHVCGDEGGDFITVFGLEGSFAGVTFGDPQFEFDQEGINLYDTRAGSGYLVVSDQYRSTTNEFEVFERASLAPRGNFQSAPDGPETSNTDGAFLEQRPLPGFPNGAFYPVNDDRNLHAYDWTDIAAGLDLDIVALDRPFVARAADDSELRVAARSTLWFHDGSWWGALPVPDGVAIHRLEDGTFTARTALSGSTVTATAAVALGAQLWVLVTSGAEASAALTLHELRYAPALRRYEPAASVASPGGAHGPRADLIVEADAAGVVARGWIAWVDDGVLRVAAGDADLSAWEDDLPALGTAGDAIPRLVRVPEAIACVWAEPSAVALRVHRDGEATGVWSPREEILAAAAGSVAAAPAPDGSIHVAAGLSTGGIEIRRRSAPGVVTSWEGIAEGSLPALVIDPRDEMLHVVFARVGSDGRRLFHQRAGPLSDLATGGERLLIGWPGVELGELAVPRDLAAEARDGVAAAIGSDARGYFGRLPRPDAGDRSAPITLQHAPPPGDVVLGPGVTVSFRIIDDESGVDRESLRLLIDGEVVEPLVRGVPRNLLVSYPLSETSAGAIDVRIEAADRALPARVMAPFEYTFTLHPAGEEVFRRGDANDDASIDIADPVRLLFVLFAGGPPPDCPDADDVNDDGVRDVSDVLFLLGFLFRSAAPPAAPFAGCGVDPTPDDGLGCATSDGCD